MSQTATYESGVNSLVVLDRCPVDPAHGPTVRWFLARPAGSTVATVAKAHPRNMKDGGALDEAACDRPRCCVSWIWGTIGERSRS